MIETMSPPTDVAVCEALEPMLSEAGLASIRRIDRRPSAYQTSFPLEELDATLLDGTRLHLVFKQLAWVALDEESRLAKPEFLHDPLREPAVYASVLPSAPVGPPRCYGSSTGPTAGHRWLFIERIEGRELYQVGEIPLWEAAARWLGKMHLELSKDLEAHIAAGRLVEYDAAYYRRWLERAHRFAAELGDQGRGGTLERLAARYDEVVEGLLALPSTVLHGEFYASNVLVDGPAEACRVAPVDWELAGHGPGLVDLAALVSGGWREGEREAIVAAYNAAVGADSFEPRQLDLARLHLAVQWLGWAPPRWVPPEGQRHDWLGEAVELAERLGL